MLAAADAMVVGGCSTGWTGRMVIGTWGLPWREERGDEDLDGKCLGKSRTGVHGECGKQWRGRLIVYRTGDSLHRRLAFICHHIFWTSSTICQCHAINVA